MKNIKRDLEREKEISLQLTRTLLVNTQNTFMLLLSDEEKLNSIISIILTSYLNAMASVLMQITEEEKEERERVIEILNGLKNVIANMSFLTVIDKPKHQA